MKRQKLILWVLTLTIVILLAAYSTQAVIAKNAATVASTATSAPDVTLEPIARLAAEPAALNEEAKTPTAIIALTGEKVSISLAKNTICRTGPSTVYPSVTTIPAGQKINAIGKLANNSSYTYIENPSTPGSYCWVFSEGATTQGNRSDLLVIEPLPTPTPKSDMGFSITYSGIKECGDDYSFKVIVANTEKLVWQSIKLYIVDVKTERSITIISDHFDEYSNCQLDNSQGDLAKGERVFMTPFDPGHFDYSPYGKNFKIRVTLCSEKGLEGTCLTKEIKVQP